MSLELDHIIICVPDLDDAVRTFETEHGVKSLEGGRHEGHGTANRIVPLGPNYIELLAVVDEDEAGSSPLGRWVLDQADIDGGGVCLRTDDLDAECARLGLVPSLMSRVTPDGVRLNWRIAGLEQALSGHLPFFITWNVPPEMHPGCLSVTHPAGNVRLTSVTLSGDHVAKLREWAPSPAGLDYVAAPRRAVSYRIVKEETEAL